MMLIVKKKHNKKQNKKATMAQFHALPVGLELAYDRGSRGGTNLHQKRSHPHQPLLGARSSVIPWEYETTLLGERHKLV